MIKLSKFLLLAFYVMVVLFVTTVEAKDYIYRTEEKAEEQSNLEKVMARTDAPSDDAAYKEQDSSEEQSANEGQNTNEGQGDREEQDSDEKDGGNQIEREYLEHFDKLRAACEQFIAEYSRSDEPKDSYEKTLKTNEEDKKCILENKHDFSQVKIACMGDSVTSASNLEDEENYEQYAYPAVLKELLGAEEVYNLGIGGSSIGRYWYEPIVERYTDIPDDTDIIIVMGGYNDGFSAGEEEFGSLEERKYGTFCGDLDELMRGIKENYPDAIVFFATPLSTALHGALMSQREGLLPQEDYVHAIEVLSKEYGFEFVDLYNTGILDSYDENIVKEFIPDTTHGNHAGYRILAERFACEIVKYYNNRITREGVKGKEMYERRVSAVQ